MLEFIVLGQVPGTGFVITFGWAVTLVGLLIGTSLLRRQYKHRNQSQQVSIEDIAL